MALSHIDTTKRAYREGALPRYNKMLKEGTHTFTFMGQEMIIYEGVFSPKYFEDSEFFASTIPIKRGANFLEIGCGSGIVSLAAAIKGAQSVTATDRYFYPVWNTMENVERFHNLMPKTQFTRFFYGVGDVFDVEPRHIIDRKFDVIFWNTPFGYTNRPVKESRRALWDQNYAGIRKYIEQGHTHLLAETGRLLIGFSTSVGKYGVLKRIAQDNGCELELLTTSLPHFRNPAGPVQFEIFEVKKSK